MASPGIHDDEIKAFMHESLLIERNLIKALLRAMKSDDIEMPDKQEAIEQWSAMLEKTEAEIAGVKLV